MTRALVALLLGLTLTACSVPRYTIVPSDDRAELGVVDLGGELSYVIDPRTEACLLVNGARDHVFAVHVSCAKLKANVPAAARFITWEPADGAR